MSHTIKEIRFSTNWNNKLYCNNFATLRFGECKYNEGEQCSILLRKNGAYINTGFGIIQAVYKDVAFKHLYWYLPIDTGYSFNESKKLFTQFNHNIPIDDETPVNVIVISRLNPLTLNRDI